jgi:hypothetical protein
MSPRVSAPPVYASLPASDVLSNVARMAMGSFVSITDVLVINCYRLMGTGPGETPFHIFTVTDVSLAGRLL